MVVLSKYRWYKSYLSRSIEPDILVYRDYDESVLRWFIDKDPCVRHHVARELVRKEIASTNLNGSLSSTSSVFVREKGVVCRPRPPFRPIVFEAKSRKGAPV